MTDLNTIRFIEAELFAVANVPLTEENYPHGFNIQIRSAHGATKWLSITPAQLKEIEDVLFGR